jgi:hypothetical protein
MLIQTHVWHKTISIIIISLLHNHPCIIYLCVITMHYGYKLHSYDLYVSRHVHYVRTISLGPWTAANLMRWPLLYVHVFSCTYWRISAHTTCCNLYVRTTFVHGLVSCKNCMASNERNRKIMYVGSIMVVLSSKIRFSRISEGREIRTRQN